MRPSVTETPCCVSRPLRSLCSPPARLTGRSNSFVPALLNIDNTTDAGDPDASITAKLVRYCDVCAICCRLNREPEPIKFLNGTAGMNWPSVPSPDKLYVQLVRIVLSALVDPESGGSGRTSRTPVALSPTPPNPYQV